MERYNSVTHYSCNVHGQPNANTSDAKVRENWTNAQNATSIDALTKPQGSIKSIYGSNKLGETRPWTLSAHDFKFNIPECAYITKIIFTVRIKASGHINCDAPYGRFNLYQSLNQVKNNIKEDTGWKDGFFYYNPKKKLSNSWQNIDYVMTASDFYKKGYPISSLSDIIMGIDLRFYKAILQKDNTVSIDYVSCTIEYELSDPQITFDRITNGNNPRVEYAGESYILQAKFTNNSNAGCCNGTSKAIKIDLPKNADVVNLKGDFDLETNEWNVLCVPFATSILELEITDYGTGLNKINFSNDDMGSWDYWVYSIPPVDDVGKIRVFPQTIQQGVVSCIEYNTIVTSSDGSVTIFVDVDRIQHTTPDLTWSIDYDYTPNTVTIDSENTNNSQITFNVPINTDTRIVFKSCFIPRFSGESSACANIKDGASHIAPYESLPTPQFIVTNNPKNDEYDREISEIELNPDIITFITHRVASDTELGAYVIDCGVADYDTEMIIDNSTLSAGIWEKLDYIGMIPLKYHHYDPKSTFENKSISESYKNKSYKGKEGVIDEDISLQFKVRPPEATTLQGLVELDKPTPINANHRCFEGDVLNHRGWVVLSKVEVERTNPLWYDVKATVDYITHDINTKFQIFKGLKINSYPMPDLQVDKFELGDNLSTGLDLFNIETDGGFIYDEEGEDGAKNIFSLDEGQHLLINTLNSLSTVSKIRFDWYSNLVDEIRENEMSRIFRLRDKDGNSVFEYEYTNFQYNDSYITCTVIIHVLNDVGGWDVITFDNIDLRTEIEADPITIDDTDDDDFIIDESDDSVLDDPSDDDDDDDIDDSVYEEGYIAPEFNPNEYDVTLVYGTSLELILNGNNLIVSDAGYNGREIYQQVQLINGEYTFETYWVNNNQDGMTEDIISYIDISLSETVLNTLYSEQYGNLIVSPYPIPNKKLVFSRESEEGTIYYLTGEEPFKYRLEPFYQYYCGTDLVTRDGISIFNLNNSYTYFYIENGLVRLGFDKLNARLYLAKWDIISKQWITTHYFQMKEDTIFSVPTYSDDKIVIKAGNDTLFTIWRGHPYVMVQNPTDSIDIISKFNYCFADSVNGVNYEYPLIHSFMNSDNLLPECIGGKKIDYDCIDIDDDIITPTTDHDIELVVPELTALESVTLGSTLTPSTEDGEVHYLIDGIDIGSAEYPFNLVTEFNTPREYTIQAVYVGDEDDNIAISEKITVKVNAPNPKEGSDADDGTHEAQIYTGEYKLEIVNAPKKFTYKDGKEVTLQLTRGGVPMPNMIVEAQLPNGHTQSMHTDAEGKIHIVNNQTDYVTGKWQWGGRFYDNWDDDSDKKLLYKALKWIEIEKATPSFKSNASDGRVNKGNSFIIKLKGVETGLDDKKLTYTINGGSKKTKTTNSKGNIHIPCNVEGTYDIKVYFAGSTRYNKASKKFTIKVI